MTASQKQTLKHLLRVLVILVVLLAAVVLIRRHQASKAQEADASASTSARIFSRETCTNGARCASEID